MMARSHDELIDFLLAEIASSGAHGKSSLLGMPHIFGRLSQWESPTPCYAATNSPFHPGDSLLCVTNDCMMPYHAQHIPRGMI
jgi:hypothetical protein